MNEVRLRDVHTPREVERHLIEVHVAGVCFRQMDSAVEVLVAKRKASRALYPSLFECCGGQLHLGETFLRGVLRHFHAEMHLNVEVYTRLVKTYYIQQENHVIPGVRMLCRRLGGFAWSDNHDSVEWLPWDELLRRPQEEFIPGLKKDIEGLIGSYLAVKGVLEGGF